MQPGTGSTVASRRGELYALLGDLPYSARPPRVELLAEERREQYVLEKLRLDLNGIEPVPAYFVRPLGARGRVPVVLYNHAHGGNYVLGKDELLEGRPALQAPPYAEALAARGYAALAIDSWAFGERRGQSEGALFKLMLWRGQVMWGMMVCDSLRAIDYLATRPDVDLDRLATVGLSMGSTMAWWVAALDDRVKVCIDICCLTDFETLIDAGGVDRHGVYYYVPGLLKHFDTSDINAMIAPRAHLSLAGDLDPLTPPVGLRRIDQRLRRVYAELGAPEAWRLRRYNVGHKETPTMRIEVMSFLDRFL